jgi:diguanylate cyclase (GGDEF)-like protein
MVDKKKVLIVEDTRSIIDELAIILSYENFSIIEAKDGSQGLELAKKELPDLIISDILMPNVDGYTFKLELNKNPVTGNIPFIYLTARTAKEEFRKGMNLGADDYITKPFTSEEIIKAVKSRLEKYELLKKAEQEKIDSLTRELKKEKQLSLVDPLTGAANRRGFFQKAGIEMSRAKRHKYPVTLVYLDLDNFKNVNDCFGHSTGDIVLKKLAECTINHIRATDIFARLGGDEFAILLPEADNEASLKIISRINELFRENMVQNNWPVTLSIGILTFSNLNLHVSDMLSLTDRYMYKAKMKGKNNIYSDTYN